MSSYILDPFRSVAHILKQRRARRRAQYEQLRNVQHVRLSADTSAMQESLKHVVIGAIRGIVAEATAHESRAELYRHALLMIESGVSDPKKIAAGALDASIPYFHNKCSAS